MKFKVETKIIPSTSVMFIERSLPYERLQEVGNDFDALMSYILQNGGGITGSFLRYVNECTMEKMDMEICISVKELLPESGEIKAKVIPQTENEMAQGIHKGSYAGLSAFYAEMDKWFKEQGLSYGTEPMWEIYLNNPAEVSEDELLTEVLWPIGNGANKLS